MNPENSTDEWRYDLWPLIKAARSGNVPLLFRGLKIGEGVDEDDFADTKRRVVIYRTTGAYYVAEIEFTLLEEIRFDAQWARTAGELIVWLRTTVGELDEATLSALEMAAADDPAFTATYGELVP